MKFDEKITVTKPSLPSKEEYKKYIDRIWDNKWLTNKGPLFIEFQNKLCNYLKHDYLCLTTNGHSALDIAIKGLNLSGEVITTPFTFASSTNVIVSNNLTPVFCDIKESDLTIDETKIESLITDKTSAILAVHVYGHLCNISAIDKIAKKHKLRVIYDAAHTFGEFKDDKTVAAIGGDVSIFSFHATKIFNTIEGGCIVYNNPEYKRIFDAYRNFGIETEEKVSFVGGNAKMNEFQAAMGILNLDTVDENILERKKITNLYRERLKKIKGIKYFELDKKQYTYNYSYFPILIDKDKFGNNRDYLYEELKKYGIYTRKYFYPLTCDFEYFDNRYNNIELPVSKKISEEILCLPIYNGLKESEIEYICNSINKLRGK